MIKLLKDKRPAFNPVEVRSSYQPRSSLIGRKSIKIGFDLSCAFACPTHSLNSIHISECHRYMVIASLCLLQAHLAALFNDTSTDSIVES